jgi:hypothetical protein
VTKTPMHRRSLFLRGCNAVRMLYGGSTIAEAAKASFITWAHARALAEKHGVLRRRKTWWAA